LRWDLNGKGYVSPIKFVEAVMEFEKLKASAPDATPDDGPIDDTPPSFDTTDLKAKKKPGKKTKLVNPVPGFGA
jgi:hypothetical protein